MPIYEYRCDNCDHEFETIQKVSEEPLKTCPACEKQALRKKVSAAGFRLKGGGWYETDFKSDKKRNVAGEEKRSKEGGASQGEGGKDAAASNSGSSKGDGAAAKPAADSGKSSSESKSNTGHKGSGSASKSKTAD